jgi:hypothetical protein
VFNVIIYPVLLDQMLRAAMVMLIKLLTKELHTIPVLFEIALSLLGCMYLASQPSCHPSGLKVHQLHSQSKKLMQKHPIIAIAGPCRNLTNSILF